MKLDDYIKSPDSMTVEELASAIGVAHSMTVRSWQHGYAGRKPSPKNFIAVERATNGLVTRKDLRPDWREIWPEHESETT